jgi:phosphoribosylamine--glycine ligase
LRWRDEAAVTVVVAASGYPGTVRTGDPITGVDEAGEVPGVHVLQAGTALADDGTLVSAGGRVLSVVGTGGDIAAARAAAYEAVARIELDGSHHRTDIAAEV